MLIRDFPAQIKAAGTADGLAEGQFEAIVSVFGNVDTYGDRVVKGAFADDVERWKSGEPLPIVWSHKWDDPFAHIGTAISAEETDRGLLVKGQIEDLEENPTAAQVHRLLKSRRVTQFSFAYDVLDGSYVVEDVKGEEGDAPMKREVFELRKFKTHEVGPCLLGVNQETELIGAKAANLALAVAGGRQLDAGSLKRLKHSVEALREVIILSSFGKADDEKPNGDTTEVKPIVDTPAEDGTLSPVPADASQTGQSPADEDPAGDKSAEAAPVIARRVALVDTLFLR